MNRNEEFYELKRSLDDSPLKLDYTLERARAKKAARAKSHKTHRAVFVPLGSLAAVFVLFVALVNVSPTFADAVSDIPALARLAEAVSFNQSLSAAVAHDYMQEINQTQTENDITATIEYVIADEKQVNVFYSLKSENYADMECLPSLKKGVGQYTISNFYSQDTPDGQLRKAVINFVNGYKAPEALDVELAVYDALATDNSVEQNSPLAVFEFSIAFDPTLVAEPIIFELGQDFELDGQRFTLEAAEINPTNLCLTLSEDPKNTAWLTDASFEIIDEDNNSYSIGGGISALGGENSRSMLTYYFDSPYFADWKTLSIRVTGALWLDKDAKDVFIDLENETAENLPEGIELLMIDRTKDETELWFSVRKTDFPGFLSFATDVWYDSTGMQQHYDYSVSGAKISDHGDSDPLAVQEGSELQYVLINNYPHDELWLKPNYTRAQSYSDSPLLTIKNK